MRGIVDKKMRESKISIAMLPKGGVTFMKWTHQHYFGEEKFIQSGLAETATLYVLTKREVEWW